MNPQKLKSLKRAIRRRRHRKKIFGTAQRPRLNIYRSLKHIYCQLIDDETGRTLLSLSTLTPEIRKTLNSGGNIQAAQILGKYLAEAALKKNIQQVVLDRGPFIYHGRIKALAEAARAGGLKF